MLHKSFKPAKCKTSLKLASSRIKLMKNKKGVQINQIKKDLAQLLESGQDRTARIRVEHAIREEKMVAAYDLIEIYCELIVARLPIIESQKTCPIDLKEAITSVIFAAPRCSDIPELLDVRKHFTAKYGKEFVTAAIELRPDCGVSRMLVEKLSAVAPDVQTKIKVLSDVAKGHNIKWDPNSFEESESKPPDDLLNGPASLEKSSMANAEPPKFQSSNTVHSHEEKHDAPVDFSQENRRFTLGIHNIASVDTGGITSSAAPHAEVSSPASERMDVRQPFPRDGYDSSSYRQNWNMEFKDATSAAQAAAESAELASMAARAAAQLSSQGKITRQHSSESHESNFKNERPQVSGSSEFPVRHHSRDSYGRNAMMQDKQIDRSEQDRSWKATERVHGNNHGGVQRSSTSASSKSKPDSTEDEKMVNNFQRADAYFQESSQENKEGPFSPETSTKKEFRESRAELGSQQESSRSENVNYFAEEVIKNQSISASHSRSGNFSDEDEASNSSQQKFGKRPVVGNPFAVDQGNILRETSNTSSYVDATRDDDDGSNSDNDGPRFDTGMEFDEGEVKSHFPSPGRESPSRPVENSHTWSPRRTMTDTVDHASPHSHIFSERHSFSERSVKSVDPLEEDNHMPVTFDHSDGPDSESESELVQSSFSGMGSSHHKQDLFSSIPEPTHMQSEPKINPRKSRIELTDLVESGSSFNNSEDEETQQSLRLSLRHELKDNDGDRQSYDTVQDDSDILNQSNDVDTEMELNFGTLTGGLRNKGGFRYPPYTKSAATDALSSSKKTVEESSTTVEQASFRSSFHSRVNRIENRKPSVSSSDSDSDDFGEKIPLESPLKLNKQSNSRSQFSPPVAFLNDDGTDSEEEVPKQTSTSKARLGSGLSRRTKGSPLASYSKSHVEPEVKTGISSPNNGRKSSRHSYIPAEPQSYAGRFKKEASTEIPSSPISKHEESRKSVAVEQPFLPARRTAETGNTEAEKRPSMRSQSEESTPEPLARPGSFKQEVPKASREPKISTHEEHIKLQPVEQPLNPPRKAAASVKTETSKTSNLSSETSGETAFKQPSHVHPKLPDYDSLASRLQSLRANRQ